MPVTKRRAQEEIPQGPEPEDPEPDPQEYWGEAVDELMPEPPEIMVSLLTALGVPPRISWLTVQGASALETIAAGLYVMGDNPPLTADSPRQPGFPTPEDLAGEEAYDWANFLLPALEYNVTSTPAQQIREVSQGGGILAQLRTYPAFAAMVRDEAPWDFIPDFAGVELTGDDTLITLVGDTTLFGKGFEERGSTGTFLKRQKPKKGEPDDPRGSIPVVETNTRVDGIDKMAGVGTGDLQYRGSVE